MLLLVEMSGLLLFDLPGLDWGEDPAFATTCVPRKPGEYARDHHHFAIFIRERSTTVSNQSVSLFQERRRIVRILHRYNRVLFVCRKHASSPLLKGPRQARVADKTFASKHVHLRKHQS
jgi:hypothetical protein